MNQTHTKTRQFHKDSYHRLGAGEDVGRLRHSRPCQGRGPRLGEGQPQGREAANRLTQQVLNIHFHLVDGIQECGVVQGGDPEESLVEDLEEDDVDEDGEHRGKEEAVEFS